MTSEPTQRDIYDRIAAVDNKLTELSATVRVQLDHGARRMDDLGEADADLSRRVSLLEQARWKATGAASVAGMVAGTVASTIIYHVWH